MSTMVPSACQDATALAHVAATADTASQALAGARAAGAGRRAPVNLAAAEESYAAGLLERRRQELRPAPFRRFDRAVEAFGAARARAQLATELTTRMERRDRRRTNRVLVDAGSALAPLHGVEERLWISSGTRSRLQRARALAAEASTLSSRGEHARAEERARMALSEARTVRDAVHHTTTRYRDPDALARWRRWVAEAVETSRRTGKAAVVVDKDAHRLTLYERGRAVRTWPIDLGWNNAGEKSRLGDGATPEGRYRITAVKARGASRYYKALLLDYPNADDLRELERLKQRGAVPRDARAGGLIEVHGEGGRGRDWTDGCVAMDNADLDVLFARVAVGTPVTIVGSVEGAGRFSDIARSLER